MFKNSIDSVLADFTKAATRLTALAEIHKKEADTLKELAAVTLTAANKADQEAARATTIAHKINTLIS